MLPFLYFASGMIATVFMFIGILTTLSVIIFFREGGFNSELDEEQTEGEY